MQWQCKKLTYDILIPKLEKNISRLNNEEAATYFKWYMECVPQRVAYVSKVCAKELLVPVEKLDCSPDSLLLIWKWFRRRAKTEPLPHSKKDCNSEFPAGIWKNKKQLTLETEYIIRDIGMYLGETFRKNIPGIYWTYYTEPRRDFFVNRPLLKGFVDRTFGEPFDVYFEPIHMTHVQAANILDKTSQNEDLFKLYNWWSQKR